MKLKDKKIQILKPTHGVDDSGFNDTNWQPIHKGKLWAYYRHLSGKEFFASATVNATEEVLFIINWREDLAASMVVTYKGNIYEITRVDDYEGYKKDLHIYCKIKSG
jgi:SPP1 family predicted phage head-tail adaptor